MMTILSHSPAGARSRVASSPFADLQEGILVAPDKIDFQQLQAQIAPVRFALQRDSHQVGGLVVQAVRHVEIGLGEGIALIEIDRALARHGVFGRLEVRGNRPEFLSRLVELRHRMLAGFLDEERVVLAAAGADSCSRITEIRDVGGIEPRKVAAAAATGFLAAPPRRECQTEDQDNDHPGR